MTTSKFLAFDLGAESGRAIIGIINDEKIVLDEIHRFYNKQIKIENSNFWDVPFLFNEIKKGIKLAVSKGYKDIRSIGIDTWGVDFGMLGKDGKLLELPHTYRDNRTEGIPEKVFERISRRELYELTGIQIMNINSIYQLYSIKLNNESLLKKCDKILFMPDLFNYLLTSKKKSEYTIASTSQLLNAKEKIFDERIFSALNLPLEITAPIVQPGTNIGQLSPELSKETGLDKVDVIAVGSHDTASAVAAVPDFGNDWAYISSGTWSLLGIESDIPLIDRQLKKEFTNEGGVNGKITFLKNITGMWLVQEVKKVWAQNGENLDYDQIMDLAVKAKRFVSYIDTDDNSFRNPENMINAIDNFCKRTSQKVPVQKGEYIRSVLESLAYKYKVVLQNIEKVSGRKIDKIHILGGGSQNELLNQFTADATGKKVFTGPVEATTLGNLTLQAISTGKIKSIKEAKELIANSFHQNNYYPNKDEYERWNYIPDL